MRVFFSESRALIVVRRNYLNHTEREKLRNSMDFSPLNHPPTHPRLPYPHHALAGPNHGAASCLRTPLGPLLALLVGSTTCRSPSSSKAVQLDDCLSRSLSPPTPQQLWACFAASSCGLPLALGVVRLSAEAVVDVVGGERRGHGLARAMWLKVVAPSGSVATAQLHARLLLDLLA